MKKSRVLAISDLHIPACHPQALAFAKEVYKERKCNKVVFLGDICDNHTVSNHPKNVSYSTDPKKELQEQRNEIAKWYKAFPSATVILGNHDLRAQRLAAEKNVVDERFKEFHELYNTPGWQWVNSIVIDNVYYVHGDGSGGGNICPALSAAKARMQSVVMGHYHSIAGVNYAAGPNQLIFGMNVGSLVDHTHKAMEYDKKNEIRKPIVSLGVVIDGFEANVIPMRL